MTDYSSWIQASSHYEMAEETCAHTGGGTEMKSNRESSAKPVEKMRRRTDELASKAVFLALKNSQERLAALEKSLGTDSVHRGG